MGAPVDAKTVSDAIVIYVGRGLAPFPSRSLERLAEHYDSLVAADLAVAVQGLVKDFYEVSPSNGEFNHQAAERAAQRFKHRHPEVSDDAVAALSWAYSYDWK